MNLALHAGKAAAVSGIEWLRGLQLGHLQKCISNFVANPECCKWFKSQGLKGAEGTVPKISNPAFKYIHSYRIKWLVDSVLAWLLWKPLQAGPLAQVLDLEVWVPLVDRTGLKMPGSTVSASSPHAVVYRYMLSPVHCVNHSCVPAMCITGTLSIQRSSQNIVYNSCMTLKSKDFSQQLHLSN